MSVPPSNSRESGNPIVSEIHIKVRSIQIKHAVLNLFFVPSGITLTLPCFLKHGSQYAICAVSLRFTNLSALLEMLEKVVVLPFPRKHCYRFLIMEEHSMFDLTLVCPAGCAKKLGITAAYGPPAGIKAVFRNS